MASCYLCGAPNATKRKSTVLKDSFTNHSMARCPSSDYLCERCAWVIPLRCAYFNPHKGSYVKLFARSWSWLLSPKDAYPQFGDPVDGLPEVRELPTRQQIREWIINPPEPPFTIAIAESGQKHILPWAKAGLSQDYFPVQFELDTIFLDRTYFTTLISACEKLLNLGFSKQEIQSENYTTDHCLPHLPDLLTQEMIISPNRGTRLLTLALYLL